VVDLVSRQPDRDATGPGVGLVRKRADAPPPGWAGEAARLRLGLPTGQHPQHLYGGAGRSVTSSWDRHRAGGVVC
jgi:hypothetical protein